MFYFPRFISIWAAKCFKTLLINYIEHLMEDQYLQVEETII